MPDSRYELPFTAGGLFARLHEAHYARTRCWKTLFAYQFVIIAARCRAAISEQAEENSVSEVFAEKALAGK